MINIIHIEYMPFVRNFSDLQLSRSDLNVIRKDKSYILRSRRTKKKSVNDQKFTLM